QDAFARARTARLHFLGLVSDGGVHSHMEHLVALAKTAAEAGVKDMLINAITDGRDASPTGGTHYLAEVEKELRDTDAKIATVIGRYYAMDRDHRWERTKLAWDAIVLGRGEKSSVDPSVAVKRLYDSGKTDEFLPPLIFSHADEPRVRDGDVILFFNFRADRARQLSQAFLKKDFSGFEREVT